MDKSEQKIVRFFTRKLNLKNCCSDILVSGTDNKINHKYYIEFIWQTIKILDVTFKPKTIGRIWLIRLKMNYSSTLYMLQFKPPLLGYFV